jgi:hypothetical protein
MPYEPIVKPRTDRYLVSVEQYIQYHRDGYIIVRDLISPQDIQMLYDWATDLFYGRILVNGLEPAPENATLDQLLDRIARNRIHQLHRSQPAAERGLLLPRVLDVIEALIGPDVAALQSMVFFNPPNRGGQGWHQDAYYIKTYPDSLIGAWIALEDADEENGCLWVVPGSNHEPIYPPSPQAPHYNKGFVHAKGAFSDLSEVDNVSDLDDEVNTLTRMVRKYPDPIPVPLKPGDVLFFQGHLFHRSYPNRSRNRLRRSFVTHYANARSWIPWDGGNERHILARGRTHLPHAEPLFGTPVDTAQDEPEEQGTSVDMMGMDGMMVKVETKPPSDAY